MKKIPKVSLCLLSTLLLLTACSQQQASTESSSSALSPSSSMEASGSSITSLQDAHSEVKPGSGVKLESGQETIDYANTILGDKEWQVVEDNYNRTDNTPFNLLQGNDQSLYRIYQNGVIMDMEETIVYQP